MVHLDKLPNELVLHIFSFLPLKSLVAAQGVCKKWRHLVPLADIPLARRKLFSLYLSLLDSPDFTASRSRVLEHLQPFDRQAYLDTILKKVRSMPEEFTTWVLEWPARAAFRYCWPFFGKEPGKDAQQFFQPQGTDCLSVPRVRKLQFLQDGRDDQVSALDVWWYGATHYAVLFLDSTNPCLVGKVYITTCAAWDEYEVNNIRCASSWVDYLEGLLRLDRV